MSTVALAERPVVTPAARPGKHIPALDGLRGLAILGVFVYHYGAGAVHSNSAGLRAIATVCGFGWSGVDLFFVLSGFLITGILLDTRTSACYYRNFYARRTLRIFPIYYLFIALALLIVPFGLWQKGHLYFLAYLGYPAAVIWPSLVTTLPIRLTHLWSLSVEEQFYMLWPCLIRKLQTSRQILTFCAAVGIAALCARVVFPGWAYTSLPCRMDDLALGAALAVLFRENLLQRCEKLAYVVLAASAGTIVLMCVFRHTTDHNDRMICTLGFTVIVIAYGALVALSLGPLAGIFSLRILRMFGKYSYGMYLYHFPLTAVFEHAKPLFIPFPLGSLCYVITCLVANLTVAALSFHLFEQPILALKAHFK